MIKGLKLIPVLEADAVATQPPGADVLRERRRAVRLAAADQEPTDLEATEAIDNLTYVVTHY